MTSWGMIRPQMGPEWFNRIERNLTLYLRDISVFVAVVVCRRQLHPCLCWPASSFANFGLSHLSEEAAFIYLEDAEEAPAARSKSIRRTAPQINR